MKTLFLTFLLGAVALSACKKKETEVYDPELVRSIQVQSVALETIYQLVNIHLFDSTDYPFYTAHCFDRSADTTGTTVSDTVSINADEFCPYAREGTTSGSYFSVYEIPAAGTTTSATITLHQFESNGYQISGEISYTYNSATGASISATGLTLTNAEGVTTVTADLHLGITGTENQLTGTLNGTGSQPFAYTIVQELTGNNGDVFYIAPNNFVLSSGRATLTANGVSLLENFGEGQLDNFAVYQDNAGIRKAFVLPQL